MAVCVCAHMRVHGRVREGRRGRERENSYGHATAYRSKARLISRF